MENLRERVAKQIRLEKLDKSLPHDGPLDLHKLTKAELSVAYGLIMGAEVEDIAKARFNSPHTIRNHMKAIYRKLGVRNSRMLAIRYWRIQPPVNLQFTENGQAMLPFKETA